MRLHVVLRRCSLMIRSKQTLDTRRSKYPRPKDSMTFNSIRASSNSAKKKKGPKRDNSIVQSSKFKITRVSCIMPCQVPQNTEFSFDPQADRRPCFGQARCIRNPLGLIRPHMIDINPIHPQPETSRRVIRSKRGPRGS